MFLPACATFSHAGATSLKFAKVRQVCTVVDDLERTLNNLVEHLGIGPFRCWDFGPPRLYDTTFRGRPAVWSMKVGLTWLDDIQWEVIQPMEGATLYCEHLDGRGPGIQHLLLDTGAVSLEAAAERLAQKGYPFVQSAFLNPTIQIGQFTVPSSLTRSLALRIGYVDAEAALRTSLELTRYPVGFSERFSLRSGKADFYIPRDNRLFEEALPNLRLRRLVKIGIVTRDLDATVRHWINLVGVHPWHVFDLGPDRLRQVTVDGMPAAFSVHLAWALIDDVLLQLVQPTGGASPFQEQLDTRGECVAWLGVSPSSNFDELVNHCEALGYAKRMWGALLGSHPAAWFEARKWIGTDFEVLAPEESVISLFTQVEPDRIVAA